MMLVGTVWQRQNYVNIYHCRGAERDEGECVVFERDFKNMNHREQALFRGQNIGFVFRCSI